jgi:asparaginyl-tRNA synthetase
MGDLSSRRGKTQGMETPRDTTRCIKAIVPLSELLTYASTLKSITSDRGTYHMEFDHYDELPAQVQEKNHCRIRSDTSSKRRRSRPGVTRDWVYIGELGEHVGETVLSKGWIYQKRSSGKIRFIVLRDGTGYCSAFAGLKDVSAEAFEAMDKVTAESSVAIRGTGREGRPRPGRLRAGRHRLHGLEPCRGVSDPAEGSRRRVPLRPPAPLPALAHAPRRTDGAQRGRAGVSRFLLPARLRPHRLADPDPNACEGTSTLFETPYFDDKAYLTQSGQLYLEPACMAFGRVYCFGPTFRAEKSKTRRHLTEFWMIEPEVAFLELPGLLELAEEFVSYVVGQGRSTAARRARRFSERTRRISRRSYRRFRGSRTTRPRGCCRPPKRKPR